MTRFRFFFLFLWVSTVLTALDPAKAITQYTVQVWDMEAGLPGNSIFAIQQTRDGYLWIGTQDGLVRFDGLNFQLFTKGKKNPLKDNKIRALCEDGNGILWIGTSSGGLTRYKDGEFTTYPASKHESLHRISAIAQDRRDNLWIASITKGLTCLSNGKFTTYSTKQGLPHNRVRAVYKDGNADLWATTAGGIVKILGPGNFRVYAPQNLLPYYKTVCLYEEDTKNLWIGTGRGGLFRMKNNSFTVYGTEVGIPQRPITNLYRDRMKNLWIGTDGGGLTRLFNGEFSTLRSGDGLADGFVYAITEDREGSLWVGTLDGGLHRLRDGKFTTYTTREGLVHDYTFCIHETRDGRLWIGTKGGLSLLGARLDKPFAVLSNTAVSSLYQAPSGRFLIGTWEGLHNFKNGKHTILTKKDGLSDNRISCIFGDGRGNTWIGTRNGLNRLDGRSGRLTVFSKAENATGNSIAFILEDSRRKLLIGTDAGLNTLEDGASAYSPEPETGKDLFRCVYEDKEGILWFGTDSGLIRMVLKEKEKVIYTYNVQSGLIENDIYSILEDERGYLWLAGRNGISRVSKKELADFAAGKIPGVQPENYNEKDGMKSRWCTGTAYKTRDGRLWFPTSVGVTVIDPNQIKTNPIPPPLLIEKIIADGEPIKIKNTIELAPGTKRLEFYYTALSFINPQKIRFKIKLAGYDSDWVDMGTSRSTTYTGLSPGDYIFKVIACNPDGVWNEKGVFFSFYLKAHWYKTWWAFSFYVLFVFLGVFFFVSRRSTKLTREKKRLEQMVKERTMEINEKNLQLHEQSEKLKEMDRVKSRFFANISHEFRTPLTLIMGPLEQRLSNCRDKEQQRELNMMLRNSHSLLNLINQLLDLSKFDGGKMKLRAVRQDIVPFLKGIVNSFDSLTRRNELALTFQGQEEEILLYYDGEKLENAVLNLLFNAIKFTPAGGEISVTLNVTREPSPGFLEISFRDNGIGIHVEQLDHIFDRFHQIDGLTQHAHKGSGIGLALAKEIVNLHHGEIVVHSEEGKGSEFVIRLPLGHEHLEPGEIARRQPVETENKTFLRGGQGDAQSAESRAQSEYKDHAVRKAPSTKRLPLILVVEDNADVREYIRGPLQSLYRVEEAVEGGEGIKKARELMPDLIISDLMMPGIDGYELCRVLKTNITTSHIPVVLLTAKASEDSIIEGLETGADDYITKPFSTKVLCARIKNLIELRRQLQQKIQGEMVLRPGEISVSSLDREFIKDIQAVIEKNLSETGFSVEQMARKLYISKSSLYKKVEALTGQSPQLFLRSYRLKRAAQLLQANAGNVTEVAFEVGFSSTAYFTKCFKEKFHRLPSDYQEAV